MLDTTAQLKETIDACHDFLNFGDYAKAQDMARKFIELNATLTCSGKVPDQWLPFGAVRNATQEQR